MQNGRNTYRLKFTGGLSREEFVAACSRQPRWYHSYYFDNGYEVRGDYDIGADISDYGFAGDMSGVRVLDIGTGAGWFAHYFEQRGAEVLAVDARGYCDFDVYGRHFYPPPAAGGREPDRYDEAGRPVYDSPVSSAFWVIRQSLGSKVKFISARAYDIDEVLAGEKPFDLVFMGALLCHLRDPIGALMAARRVCAGEVVVTTPVVLGEGAGEMLPRQYLPYTEVDRISWWLPNEACFRHWLLAAGFRDVDVDTSLTLRCDLEHRDGSGRVVNRDQTLRLGRGRV